MLYLTTINGNTVTFRYKGNKLYFNVYGSSPKEYCVDDLDAELLPPETLVAINKAMENLK